MLLYSLCCFPPLIVSPLVPRSFSLHWLVAARYHPLLQEILRFAQNDMAITRILRRQIPMLLVNFSKVWKDYGGNAVFDDVNLEIIEGERIGLVGENGSGKSTLFKLIAGLDTPSRGVISRRRNLTIGYLTQEVDPRLDHKTIFEVVSETSAELAELPHILAELEAQMSDPEIADDPDTMTRVLEEYGKAQERFDTLGGYTLGHRVETVLNGLGF